jgi:RNA polymerase sigma-70 factor, ECF subfamily
MHVAALADPVLPSSAPAVSWREIASHRGYLVRFARRKLRDAALAEDAVHDVFEAVLGGRASFGGRSTLRSWLAAILKHKIVDLLRQQRGDLSLDDEDADEALQSLACPGPRPDELAEQRERLLAALERIAAMPKGEREAVELSFVHGQSTDEVCRRLAITKGTLFVRIHRARKRFLS